MIALKLIQLGRWVAIFFFGLFMSFVHRLMHPLGILAFIALVFGWPLLHYSRTLLNVQAPLNKADWIVVLGGETGERVIGAAELYHAGRAPYVFVSGSGDCLVIVRRLVMAGVPMSKIGYECRSTDTASSAQYTYRMLAAQRPKKAILVTSWYHSRRALSTYRNTWPQVTWGMHPVYAADTLYNTSPYDEAGAVLDEYLNFIWYKIKFW